MPTSFAALGRVVHRRDHQVDLALLQELHAIGGNHRLQLQLDAELVGYVLGHVGLKADDGAARIAKAEGLVIRLAADDEDAAFLNRVQGLSVGGNCSGECEDCSGCNSGEKSAMECHVTTP